MCKYGGYMEGKRYDLIPGGLAMEEIPSNNESQEVSRRRSVRQENIKLFHSMLLVTLFVRCLFIAIRISHGKVYRFDYATRRSIKSST